MQTRLLVEMLVLQAERLMSVWINLVFAFQVAPSIIVCPPATGCRTGRSVFSVCRFGWCDLAGVVIAQVELPVFVVEDVRQGFAALPGRVQAAFR